MLAISWKLNWGCRPELQNMTSPCDLAFLTAWWLQTSYKGAQGSKGKLPEKTKESLAFDDLASKVTYHNSHKPIQIQGEETQGWPLIGSSVKSYYKECVLTGIIVTIFEKHNMPHPVTYFENLNSRDFYKYCLNQPLTLRTGIICQLYVNLICNKIK